MQIAKIVNKKFDRSLRFELPIGKKTAVKMPIAKIEKMNKNWTNCCSLKCRSEKIPFKCSQIFGSCNKNC